MVIVFHVQWELSAVLSMNINFFSYNLKKFYIFHIDICIIFKFVRYFMNSETNRNQSEV